MMSKFVGSVSVSSGNFSSIANILKVIITSLKIGNSKIIILLW